MVASGRGRAGRRAPVARRRPFRAPHHQRLDAGAGRRRAARCGRARSAWRISACCSSTSCPNSSAPCSIRCASRWRPAGQRRPRQHPCHLPGAGPAGRGDEPVPLRPSRRSGAGLQPRAALRRRLPGEGVGAAARPHRPACRGARACQRRRPDACRRRPKAAPRSRHASPARARSSRARFNGSGVRTNAEADGELLDAVATPDEPGRKLLADAAAAMRLSARGFHRVLRVAAHHRRSRRGGPGRAHPYRRSAQLPPAGTSKLGAGASGRGG